MAFNFLSKQDGGGDGRGTDGVNKNNATNASHSAMHSHSLANIFAANKNTLLLTAFGVRYHVRTNTSSMAIKRKTGERVRKESVFGASHIGAATASNHNRNENHKYTKRNAYYIEQTSA